MPSLPPLSLSFKHLLLKGKSRILFPQPDKQQLFPREVVKRGPCRLVQKDDLLLQAQQRWPWGTRPQVKGKCSSLSTLVLLVFETKIHVMARNPQVEGKMEKECTM